MKKLIIILLMLPLALQAQRIHGFVSSGIMVSQIEGDEIKGYRHYGYTGGVGALASISSNNRWGLSIETMFSQRGSFENSGDPYSIKLNLNYIDIPLMIHYQDPYGGMLIGAGLIYGRLVQQPHGIMKFDTNSFIPDTSDMSFLRNDLCVALDARFSIWKGLQLNLRWQYSIIPVKRDWHFDYFKRGQWRSGDNDCYNNAVILRLIYQF